ncbi:hypothetical protein FJQ98_11050 [Lysinibacillus agricola]|uniref:Uncharacterized protein n=1 Tax=Lysinibacillus agricola TaxID=2590012 RepID=A0ABX7B262_9BACI|nr:MULTISPECIES: hypothetical protein [Lysinibacillus]KOS60204.1 hypothetical protein AN161_24185 [Lysinibacillus sp. FJAT-14222]QQP14494.1 hypothetical protein FJQ98_11050 [Lysinibacillus agricola]
MLADYVERCPHCRVSLQGDEIPKEQQKSYNATHFTRKIGITKLEADRILYWECPDCHNNWSLK